MTEYFDNWVAAIRHHARKEKVLELYNKIECGGGFDSDRRQFNDLMDACREFETTTPDFRYVVSYG